MEPSETWSCARVPELCMLTLRRLMMKRDINTVWMLLMCSMQVSSSSSQPGQSSAAYAFTRSHVRNGDTERSNEDLYVCRSMASETALQTSMTL